MKYILLNIIMVKKVIKILEKKEQNVEGFVETKLLSAPYLKKIIWIILENKFEIHYGFYVN